MKPRPSFLLLLLVIQLVGCARPAKIQPDTPWRRATTKLRARLTEELTPKQAALFRPKRVHYVQDAVDHKMMNVLWKPRSYDDYTGPAGISRARKFFQRNRRTFKEVERSTGVGGEVVTAILSVETNFGTIERDHQVLSALATLAALSIDEFGAAEESRTRKLAMRREGWTNEIGEKWHDRRVQFGEDWYQELKNFLVLCDALQWKPERYIGSWAGAIGFGQFLPSTLVKVMRTEAGTFERYDLTRWKDNIFLVARYLHILGWPTDPSPEARRAALWGYNRSTEYGNAVLAITATLENTTSGQR